MTAIYFTIPTDVGNAKEANAIALGLRRKFVALAIGDGGGDNAPVPTPSPNQTSLLGEWRRAALNTLEPDSKNPSQLIAEQIIPENEGGKWIRELALIDEDGDICYIANAPPTYKPKLSEGSGKTQTVRMVIIVSSVTNVELKIDPSVVLATREYADKATTTAVLAHTDEADPHPLYSVSLGQVQATASAAAPPGAVNLFACNSVPDGWLKCNGAAINRTTYADLFATIGTLFGAGDGTTTFNLPDLRGEFVRGWDDGRGVDNGRAMGTSQAATTLDNRMINTHLSGNQGEIGPLITNADAITITPSHPYQISTAFSTPQIGTRHSMRPRNIALLPCIKY